MRGAIGEPAFLEGCTSTPETAARRSVESAEIQATCRDFVPTARPIAAAVWTCRSRPRLDDCKSRITALFESVDRRPRSINPAGWGGYTQPDTAVRLQ